LIARDLDGSATCPRHGERVAPGDAGAREDLGVAPLAPLALDALPLLAGGVAEVLESGGVLGEPLPRSADHRLGEVGCRLPGAHQLPDEAEAALGVDLGEQTHGRVPAEIPAAEDDAATVERQPADVVGLAELREDARPVAGVPVALELALEIVGIGVRDALRMEPLRGTLGRLGIRRVRVLGRIGAIIQTDCCYSHRVRGHEERVHQPPPQGHRGVHHRIARSAASDRSNRCPRRQQRKA